MKVAAAVAATPVLITGSAQAQQKPQAPPSAVFRSRSALVALNVTVQDTAAKFVAGLRWDAATSRRPTPA